MGREFKTSTEGVSITEAGRGGGRHDNNESRGAGRKDCEASEDGGGRDGEGVFTSPSDGALK